MDKIVIAILGGILPAIAWLVFWISLDRHKEPTKLILGVSLASFIIVALSLFFETKAEPFVVGKPLLEIIINAGIEEFFKIFIVWFLVRNSKHLDEPIDFGMYLVAGALGFAAIENTLFLIGAPEINIMIQTLSSRSVGATLLHAVSVLFVGVLFAYQYHKGSTRRHLALVLGFIVATIIHAAFNYFMIQSDPSSPAITLAILWITMIIMFYVYKRIAQFK